MADIFQTLPDTFFAPLTGRNRSHYARCLLIFYRLFQESRTGVERLALMARYAEYMTEAGRSWSDDSENGGADEDSENGSGGGGAGGGTAGGGSAGGIFGGAGGASGGIFSDTDADLADGADADRDVLDGAGGDGDGGEADGDGDGDDDGGEAAGSARLRRGTDPARLMAGLVLRRLIGCGWMGEEELPDYTRFVTITAHAKPFFDALAKVDEGLSSEYEGHVVAVYSSLCGDAALESGHLAVLTAHDHAMRLVESLKVLSQSMRSHYQSLMEGNRDAAIKDILKMHYDRYIEEVVDKAYARLKTSENLSRYRPRIVKAANAFLQDNDWLDRTARSLAALRGGAIREARLNLTDMLEEIRDQLRALDPLLDEIDRRNMMYSRSSIEHIKARVRADSGLAGRLDAAARAMAGNRQLAARFQHRLHRLAWIGKESRYRRWFRTETRLEADERPVVDGLALERAEAELRLRIERQLTPTRISDWLDERIPRGSLGWAHELATDLDAFVRVLHATAYAESRPGRFPYAVEWIDARVEAVGWEFRKHGFRRRRE
jgi:hypothetical protein